MSADLVAARQGSSCSQLDETAISECIGFAACNDLPRSEPQSARFDGEGARILVRADSLG